MNTSASESCTIGWVGTGVMGAPMAGHLLAAGHRIQVSTRTPEKASALLDAGATWADSPAAACDGADIACTMVGLPSDVETVYLGDAGIFRGQSPPPLCIDFTTSTPALAERLANAASSHGGACVDAPVSGGDIGARNATLSIMVGGTDDAVTNVRPLLELLGARVVHQGGPGAGQHTKMVNQILIASTMMGVCEGLLYAERSGLDPTRVIESVGGGAAGSWSINELGPRINKGDYEPGFYIEHFIKDLGIALAEAARMNIALPGLAQAHQFYVAAASRGLSRKGTQALMLILRDLSAPAEI